MSSQHLITPEALQKLLASDPASVLVCDCRYDLVDADLGRRAYEASHIPGAVFVDLGRMLSGEKNGSNGRHPLPDQRVFAEQLASLGVNADTPYKTLPDLLKAMKDKPGSVSVATAGVNSSGHAAIETLARAAGITYKHVTYDGGAPAAVATGSGETQVTTQLAAEQADMIRAKKIRPLAVVSDKPLEMEGVGTVPPLSQFIPGFKDPINYFGIFVPKSVPAEVTQTLDKIWATEMVKNAALRTYAQSRGAMFAPMHGADAQTAVFPAIQAYAWTQHAAGKAKVSPDTVGIPKP